MASILLVCITGICAYYYLRKNDQTPSYTPVSKGGDVRPTNTPDYGPATNEQAAAAHDPAPKSIDEVDELHVTITSASTYEGLLTVRSMITPLIGSGTCTMTLRHASGAPIITQQADVQALSSSSACKNFSTPTAGLAKGTWVVEINVQGPDNKSGKETKEIEI